MEFNTKDFAEWANNPMTVAVRDHLIERRSLYNNLDCNTLAQSTVYGQGLNPLDKLGLVSVMNLSVISGIEEFTNFEVLEESMFPEEVKARMEADSE